MRARRRAVRRATCGRGGTGYFRPADGVGLDTTNDMKVYREEIFGPVVTASPFKDADADLLKRANDTMYGLAAGIYTRDIGKAHRIANRLRGRQWWSGSTATTFSMPRCPLAATSSPAGDARWVMTR